MDSTVITAGAAACGSLMGASATIVTSWINQTAQRRHTRREARLRNREAIYGDFITEASRLTMEALSHSLERPDTFVKLYGPEKATPKDRENGLRQVVDALGDGLSQTALATRLAVEEAANSSRAYAEKEGRRIGSGEQAAC